MATIQVVTVGSPGTPGADGPTGSQGPTGVQGAPGIVLVERRNLATAGLISETFSNVFTSTYDLYKVQLENVCGSFDAILSMQFLDGAGSDVNLERRMAQRQTSANLFSSDGAATFFPVTDTSTAYFSVNVGLSGDMEIVHPLDNTYYRSWNYTFGFGQYNAGPPTWSRHFGTAVAGLITVAGFRLYMNFGVFENGYVSIYGLPKS